MATVVNARDVLLQAATPRVATVSMQANLVVDQSQVAGLGIVINGTKIAMMDASSQVFQIAKNGTVSPSTIVITPTLKNISATPTITVTSGTITPAPAIVSGQITIPNANLITDTATIHLSVTEGGNTYTDDITIVKVREGIDSLTGFLTNETHTVSADSAGNVLSYAGAGGTFKVFQGTTDVTSLCVFTVFANPNGLTIALNASTGVYSISGGIGTSLDVGTVTFRATLGTSILDKVFTITKVKQGVQGMRGSRTFYATLSGASNTFSTTLADTVTNVDGGKMLNDVVTQYNNSVNFSETRFWNGASWVVVNAVVDGNLLVTGSVGASKLSVLQLSAITASIGTLRTASTGARMEISDNVMKVFDNTGSGIVRVQLGDLTL